MDQLFRVTLGVDYAARDTGRRITMCVREADPLSAAIKAEQQADKALQYPDVEYTHAIESVPVARQMPAVPVSLALAA